MHRYVLRSNYRGVQSPVLWWYSNTYYNQYSTVVRRRALVIGLRSKVKYRRVWWYSNTLYYQYSTVVRRRTLVIGLRSKVEGQIP